ncbi:MAG: hypothetical protein DLM73_07480 [Chthoniobacterales bacterium]|nr:MAG: hypothetical protein DLM73_07480 [Chthoniobacterales bacterium]
MQWEDAFEVDFDDGLSFLEPHSSIRAANHIAKTAKVQSVQVEDETKIWLLRPLRQRSNCRSLVVVHSGAVPPKRLALARLRKLALEIAASKAESAVLTHLP